MVNIKFPYNPHFNYVEMMTTSDIYPELFQTGFTL